MRKGLMSVVMAACLCAPGALGQAQETPSVASRPPSPAGRAVAPEKPAKAVKARPMVPAGEAETRYRAWVQREHAEDAVDFQKDKAKIEDKYKGYVRPKHPKKAAKASREAKPAK